MNKANSTEYDNLTSKKILLFILFCLYLIFVYLLAPLSLSLSALLLLFAILSIYFFCSLFIVYNDLRFGGIKIPKICKKAKLFIYYKYIITKYHCLLAFIEWQEHKSGIQKPYIILSGTCRASQDKRERENEIGWGRETHIAKTKHEDEISLWQFVNIFQSISELYTFHILHYIG